MTKVAEKKKAAKSTRTCRRCPHFSKKGEKNDLTLTEIHPEEYGLLSPYPHEDWGDRMDVKLKNEDIVQLACLVKDVIGYLRSAQPLLSLRQQQRYFACYCTMQDMFGYVRDGYLTEEEHKELAEFYARKNFVWHDWEVSEGYLDI